MVKGTSGFVFGRSVLETKRTRRQLSVGQIRDKLRKRQLKLNAGKPVLSPQEVFMKREGVSKLSFDNMLRVYNKHVALKPQNVDRAPDVLAQEVAREANIPYFRAVAFVGWAKWEFRQKAKEPTTNGKKV